MRIQEYNKMEAKLHKAFPAIAFRKLSKQEEAKIDRWVKQHLPTLWEIEKKRRALGRLYHRHTQKVVSLVVEKYDGINKTNPYYNLNRDEANEVRRLSDAVWKTYNKQSLNIIKQQKEV